MTLRLLILQNDPLSPAGILGERLAARGGAAVLLHPHDGDRLPEDPGPFDAVLLLGGPIRATDDENYPALRPTVALVRAFHAAQKPVMGICLGAQIVARSFGAAVGPQGALELGYAPVAITAAGARDPLLAGLPRRQRFMQWHEDSFALPAGAVPLMTGTACRNQAFRLGRATYGFQCHYEATPALAAEWLDGYGHSLPAHLGDAAPAAVARVRAELARHGARAARTAAAIADRWLALAAAARQRAAG